MIELLDRGGGYGLWLVDLDHAMPLAGADAVMDRGERERIRRIVDPVRRARRARCRAALRQVLGEILDTRPEDVALGCDRRGKPCVETDTPLSFSVSHSGPLGVIVAGGGEPIGVDIEFPRPQRGWERLAKRRFSPWEAQELGRVPIALLPAGFLRCWTVKEALAKALGIPLPRVLDEVIVDPDPRRSLRVIHMPGSHNPTDWALRELRVLPGDARLAVARRTASESSPTISRGDPR